MKIVVPSIKLLDEAGGSLVFTVPIANIGEIGPIFSLIENETPMDDDEPKMIASINDEDGPEEIDDSDLTEKELALKKLRGLVIDCGLS